MQPQEIVKIFKNPEWDLVSAIKTKEAEFIYLFLKEKNITKTLEVGFATGMSATHIIAATENRHITIDPHQKNYDNYGLKNIEALACLNILISDRTFPTIFFQNS